MTWFSNHIENKISALDLCHHPLGGGLDWSNEVTRHDIL